MHINDCTVGPRGHQIAQLWLAAILMMPANSIHKLVMLLDGADQFQVRNLEYFYWSGIRNTPRQERWMLKLQSNANRYLPHSISQRKVKWNRITLYKLQRLLSHKEPDTKSSSFKQFSQISTISGKLCLSGSYNKWCKGEAKRRINKPMAEIGLCYYDQHWKGKKKP